MGGTDSTEIAKAVKDAHEGSRDIELVMNPVTGEMEAMPKSQADRIDGVKATSIAKKPYYYK